MGLWNRKIKSAKKNSLDPRIIIWAWGALEADFWRFYKINLQTCILENIITWRRFLIFIKGLPPESAFVAFCQDKKNRNLLEFDESEITSQINKSKRK